MLQGLLQGRGNGVMWVCGEEGGGFGGGGGQGVSGGQVGWSGMR